MINKDFEKQLQQLKLKAPTKNYKIKAKQILSDFKPQQTWFKWSYVLAFSLLLSLGFNVYLYSQPQIVIKTEALVAAFVDDHSTAQKSVGGYSITQGAMVPYGGNRDITIILEN